MNGLTRRTVLRSIGSIPILTGGALGYAAGVEPAAMLTLKRYAIATPLWPFDRAVTIVVVADLHVCEPYMSARRVGAICDAVNRLQPDLIVNLGDFNGGHLFVTRAVWPDEWIEPISRLKAPLGVWSILGNHDWWHGPLPNMKGDEGESVRRAIRASGSRLLENEAVRIPFENASFWLIGLADQLAYRVGRGAWRGADDLAGSLAQVANDQPVILLAHEPMIFDKTPERVLLTLCGHTHGGQINLPFVGSPYADARFGRDRVYGHMEEAGRHLIISGGLGESIAPLRFMRPPELVHVVVDRSPSKLNPATES
jgi:hypothetical protein